MSRAAPGRPKQAAASRETRLALMASKLAQASLEPRHSLPSGDRYAVDEGLALGSLLLVPNTLDLGTAHAPSLANALGLQVIAEASRLTHWVAEDAKVARAFLKRVAEHAPLALPLQSIQIEELPRPPKGRAAVADPRALSALLAPALQGRDIGLISDAGLPAVADPGALLVAAAHAAGIRVWPLAGASSLMLALAASGLNGQRFAFAGYLPTDGAERSARVRAMEATSRREQQTQIAIETPYRNAVLAAALLEALHPATRLCIACGVTLPGGWCVTRAVGEWRAAPPQFTDKHLPAVFLWLAS
jgi:16S rRNA (cytidine1402-2'-O)-methyltransferase